MKELYLHIFKKYKLWIILIYFIFSLAGVYFQYTFNQLNEVNLVIIFISYIFCLYVWLNGYISYALPVDEKSNMSDVFFRWVVITSATLSHLYFLVSPLF